MDSGARVLEFEYTLSQLTAPPQISSLKQHSHTLSVGQESRIGLAGWLKLLQDVPVKLFAGSMTEENPLPASLTWLVAGVLNFLTGC